RPFFFSSSRRRHTRSKRDWSSDVCSSDLGAYFMVDMAHIAGLVAGGAHPSPVPHADVTTSTSHKTLRGPRGGFILSNDEEIAKKIGRASCREREERTVVAESRKQVEHSTT